MKIASLLRIAILALVTAMLGRFAWISMHELREDRLASELCGMVGNQLEIGSLREAFEGLQLGLARNQMPQACVSVIDNGRSYSPDCLNPAVNYRINVCRPEANKGVRAQISYPTKALFGPGLWFTWLAFAGIFIAVLLALRTITRQLTVRVASEIEMRLLHKGDDSNHADALGHILGLMLEKSGLAKIVHREISALEEKLNEFEAKARLEAVLRARQEAESAKSKEYLERVRQIRHDIRSPLSALFAARSAINGDESLHKTLTSSIRGIEKMIEELHQLEYIGAGDPVRHFSSKQGSDERLRGITESQTWNSSSGEFCRPEGERAVYLG
ncbi:MAG: hypothetical protein NDI61_06405 [Bdellovibrionaceae bacterium]|nr:hypothetical protein [Pseudobdellovibrionaceae bacterium]